MVNQVSVRDLRNRGGDVLDDVERGATMTVTRNGRPVAELRPIPKARYSTDEVWEQAQRLPSVDADSWRRDIDSVIAQSW